MADPIPASVPPAPEEKPKAPAKADAPALQPVFVDGRGRDGMGRVWGIVDLVLLLAVAAGAAFYAMKETIFRHESVVFDHPSGPLTHVRDGSPGIVAPSAPILTTAPVAPGDAPVSVQSAK